MENKPFSTEEIKGTIVQIEFIIRQIGQIDISIDKHKTLREVDEEDASVASYRRLRSQFVQQLADMLADFNIHLEVPNTEILWQKAA